MAADKKGSAPSVPSDDKDKTEQKQQGQDIGALGEDGSPRQSTDAAARPRLGQGHRLHLHHHLDGHHGRMQDDSLLHFDSVNRDGRSASIVRDDEGHIVYPALVPPAVESPGPIHDAAHDYVQAFQRASGKLEGRPKAVSDPPKPEDIAAASATDDDATDASTSAADTGGGPSGERSTAAASGTSGAAAGTAPAVVPIKATRAKSSSADPANQINALSTRRKRSSTLPMPPKRRHSNVSLIQELRRTSTLHWNLQDDEDDEEGIPHRRFYFAPHSPTAHKPAEPPRVSGGGRRKKGAFWSKIARPKDKAASLQHSTKSFMSQSFRRDGRLPISIRDTSHTGYLAKAVGAAVRRITQNESPDESDEDDVSSSGADADANAEAKGQMSPAASEFHRLSRNLAHMPVPKLNIVIMVIGSRGDIQPFLKIGKVLKEKYGHRVRVATHPAFRDFIEKDTGLEFFSVGGDPAELMAFMVKNPGMIPSLATVKSGDIGRRRDSMAEMFEGFWRACVDATDDPNDIRNLKLVGDKEPFIADAIIANPPSFAHVHCAEALGIPLHLMFTFPYTPTQAFPHPLANVMKSSVDPGYTNFISYPLIDMMVWQGLGDLVNNFRIKTLDLDPISMIWAPGAVYRMHVPFTYLWSPGLVPKPEDWGPEIDIAGFVFLDLASSFTPPSSLESFLAASEEPPIYIGFGSIVVDDADSFTEMIFEAVRLAGVRALVSKGWGGFGGKGDNVPDNIYMLDNTPHDWLFPKVKAAVIHGGAGTTAIALKCGLPTMVVPFFGDQYFWGSMLERAKVGPKPVPYKRLTAERLAEGIRYLLSKEARSAAQTIAASIEREGDGAENACRSFLRTLELEGQRAMRCSIFPDRVAVWWRKGSNIRLSALAADALVAKGYMSYRNLRLIRHTEWNDFEGPGEPITAVFGSLVRSFKGVVSGPFSAASRLISIGKKNKHSKDAKDSGNNKQKQTEDISKSAASTSASEQDNSRSGSRSNEANSLITLRNGSKDLDDYGGTTRKADDGSFEVVFEAVGKSFGKSALALFMAPVDLYFALCQGFHNAPRLYGDDTVRRPPHVTGIQSGLVAAGSEFVFGIYDGVSGVVRLPIRWTRDHGGIHGFIKGTGMGLMGFVLKDISAIIGPLGYVMKGLAKQAGRSRQPMRKLRRVRMAQAQREMRALSEKDRERLQEKAVTGWKTMHALYHMVQQKEKKEKKSKKVKEETVAAATALQTTTHTTMVPRRGSDDNIFQHHYHHSVGLRNMFDLDVALESADLAAVVLAAMRQGETLESVVKGRHNCSTSRRRRRLCPYSRTPPEHDVDHVPRKQLIRENIDHEEQAARDQEERDNVTPIGADGIARVDQEPGARRQNGTASGLEAFPEMK